MKKLSLNNNNIFIYIIVFFLLITIIQSMEENNYDFLNDKTQDHLRQIYWSAKSIFKGKTSEIKIDYDIMWNISDIKEIKNKIITYFENNIEHFEDNIDYIKNNQYFNVKNESTINKLIEKEDLDKNYLINFAFNIDKYDRTQKKEINSVSDYIICYTRDQLKKFIYDKLNIYRELYDPANFTKIVLNNINFNYTNTKDYVSGKTKEELIQYLYGFEKYCFNTDKSVEEDCFIAFNLYNHDNFKLYTEYDLNLKLSTYYKKTNLDKDLDKFIFLIENREFRYPSISIFLNSLDINQLSNNVKALETYYKRQTNTTNSLKKLDEYIELMSITQKREILTWGINLYPELFEKNRFDDILSSEKNLQFGQIKAFVKVEKRDILLKYAYNIHTFHNNITSIYDDDLYDFIRMNENYLYEKLFKDINKNKKLQSKNSFTLYANLHEKYMSKYLNISQRNQLKLLTKSLIQFYYDTINQNTLDNIDPKIQIEKRLFIESLEKNDQDKLIDIAKKYAKKLHIKDTNFFIINNEENKYISKYFNEYENIMDFFRSTDINYLRIWLRKYELIIRKIKSEGYVSGGLKTNFLNINEYTKDELLSDFDIYVQEYPELFYPEKFIKIVGLDTDKTPHKYLVENARNEIIKKITSSIIGHFQRKNIQLSFNETGFLSYIYFKILDDKDNNLIKDRYLYQLFRLINIFPELNNKELFEIMCVNEDTRILESNDIDKETIEEFYKNKKDKLPKIIENINHYYKKENKNINKEKGKSDIEYIKDFLSDKDIVNNEKLKTRVFSGDFYLIFYDFSYYLDNLNEIIINNIYNILKQENKIKNDTDINLISIGEKKDIIINISNKYQELQDPVRFDKQYNYINFSSEYPNNSTSYNLYEFLENSSTKNLFYYTLITNIKKIEQKNITKNNNSSKNPEDIYLKIRYMSRVAMIRYILDMTEVYENLRELINENELPNLVKYYMLDIGSDNIYDLTLY